MRTLIGFGLLLAVLILPAKEDEEKPEKVAGKADVLKHVKKYFASYAGQEGRDQIRLRIEGEAEDSTWTLHPEVEIRIDGWWGRVGQLKVDDRVWVWLAVDRSKKPVSVLLIADEPSEMDIHGQHYTIQKVTDDEVTVHIPGEKKVEPRTLKRNALELKEGDRGRIQSSDGGLRRFLPEENFEEHRGIQEAWLRERWRAKGLPGMISFLHSLSGEMEIFLDHEAKRWGRYLRNGDDVVLSGDGEKKAKVKFVEPWRERTRVRLVSHSGMDQLDLKTGERIALRVPEPPKKIQDSENPTDLDFERGEHERVDWFLSTLYCPCGIAGDRCTGMYYALSSCNVNTCGAPEDMREVLEKYIGEGMSDREIFLKLKKERGRDVWQPHLLR